MLIIVIKADVPIGYDPAGIKEQIAMRLDDLSDIRVSEVREVGYEQLSISN